MEICSWGYPNHPSHSSHEAIVETQEILVGDAQQLSPGDFCNQDQVNLRWVEANPLVFWYGSMAFMLDFTDNPLGFFWLFVAGYLVD